MSTKGTLEKDEVEAGEGPGIKRFIEYCLSRWVQGFGSKELRRSTLYTALYLMLEAIARLGKGRNPRFTDKWRGV